MEQHFRNYQIDHKFQEKGRGLLEIEKKESKKLKLFRNYSSRLAKALSTIRAGRARAIEEIFKRKLTEN